MMSMMTMMMIKMIVIFLMYQLCVLQIVTPNHFLQDIVKSHVTYGGLNLDV